MEPSQVSFGNFSHDVSSAELAEFLEMRVGLVLRCKIKAVRNDVPPHAFVHFESAAVAKEACKLADRGRLLFREFPLKARQDDRLGRRGFTIPDSPANIRLTNVKIELGSLPSPKTFLVDCEGPAQGLNLRIEPDVRRMHFSFREELAGGRGKSALRDLMLEIRLADVRLVKEIQTGRGDCTLELLLQLWSPPYIFYRTADDDVYEYYHETAKLADDEDPWIRSLDVITANQGIGRCLYYRIRVQPRQCSGFKKAVAYFSSLGLLHNKRVASMNLVYEEKRCQPSVQPFYTVPTQKSIPFDLMFMINALVHHDILHEKSLDSNFYRLLQPECTPIYIATFALRYLLNSYRKRVFDATKRLQSIIDWAKSLQVQLLQSQVSEGNMVVRRILITPTRAICLPPEPEMSNRVLRHYSALSDRFLRVSFVDENFQPISSGALSVQVAPIVRTLSGAGVSMRTAIYRRVLTLMNTGFWLCGRNYLFLAFSPNQLRDNSAWFFARNNEVGVDDIRQWMGIFPTGSVAKYAARMGQCFSSTYSTLRVPIYEMSMLPDICRNGYTFSDGCGKISPTFADQVAVMLKLDKHPPSAYQIRYAGYKGVVAVWPIGAGPVWKLALRESMKKFLSKHSQLEIVNWSRFLPCFLNRQIITLLSTLNVEDSVFVELQDTMVDTLNRMVDDRDLGYSVLLATCSGEMYSTPIRMLCAGFRPQEEPYLRSILVATRAGQIEELVQKTKIFVPKARWLLGCLDEAAILEYGQCFLCVSSPPTVDVSGRTARDLAVIRGRVVVTKNPCMHPGDIRVLEAVDVPALHHMVDCLIFPQKGPRPHPNEASGSDLDGDIYFVCWDERLIPPSGQSSEPMDYISPPPGNAVKQTVKTEDVAEFFVKHMVNDSLGRICNAHVVHADLSPLGAMDENCLFLAKLAARAVDYPKTGKPAVMPHDLRPKHYPDFMGKENAKSYKSKKILGILYRKIQEIEPQEDGDSKQVLESCPMYDSDLKICGFEAFTDEAWILKQVYDQKLRAIMDQFNISDEGRCATGHVILGSRATCRKSFDLKERVEFAFRSLQTEFLDLFKTELDSKAEDEEGNEDVSEERRALQQKNLEVKASAWYHVTYHPTWYRKMKEGMAQDTSNKTHLLSFAWVAVEYLALIKNQKLKSRKCEATCANVVATGV